MLYKVVLAFASVDEITKCTIPMKATEKHFPVVPQQVILNFKTVYEIPNCDQAMEVIEHYFPRAAVYITCDGFTTFKTKAFE